jgi:hypothetical protein
MRRPGADAERLRGFENTRADRQFLTDALDHIRADRTTPKPFPGTRKASVDPAANDRALELGECARYLE